MIRLCSYTLRTEKILVSYQVRNQVPSRKPPSNHKRPNYTAISFKPRTYSCLSVFQYTKHIHSPSSIAQDWLIFAIIMDAVI